MDLEESFKELARRTADVCLRRGKTPVVYRTADGQSVSGWSLHSSNATNRKDYPATRTNGGSSSWSMSRHVDLLLTTTGEVWEHGSTHEVYEGPEYAGAFPDNPHIVSRDWLQAVTGAALVGSKGKPFAEMSERLERLPYT